jgi:hypothetical protein
MVRINGFVSLTPNHSFFKIKIQKSHPEKKGYNYPGFQKKQNILENWIGDRISLPPA